MYDITRDGKLHKAGTAHCFTCGYAADLPGFVSEVLGYNDAGMYGFKWITQNFVNLSIERRQPLKLDMSRGKKQSTVQESRDVSEEELDSYRYFHPYMFERKLTKEVIDYFDIGYDEEHNALTFPIHDHQTGKVMLIQRRTVVGKGFINDTSVSKGLFIYGLYQVYRNLDWIQRVFLCESPIDALTCWTHGEAAVATMGAAVTAAQLRLLRDVPVRSFVDALDNDKAGREAAKRIRAAIKTKLLYRAWLPDDCKDINELSSTQFHSLRIEL
jgi:DNA primase